MVLLSVHTEDENTNCSVVWPHSLESMKFTRCNVDDRILKQLDSIGWPANLRHLELFDLEFSSLAFLNNLPQTLDELNMVYCYSAQFSAFEDSPKRIQFPKYLRRLNLASCRIGSLSILEFPPFLRELDLSGDRLHDLLEYEGGDIRWIDLVYLESIVLKYNSISSLRSWFPPVSLKYLNLCGCDLSEITGEAPIFNERQNKVYSNLRRIDLTNTHLFRIDDLVCVPPNVYKLDLVCNTNLELIPLHLKFFTSRLCELDLYNTPFNDLSIHNSYFDDKIKYVTFPEGPFHEFS
ncbi:L domain-like protein [Hyphopichia burtonii NRRL Y-1933]|uniref:L domain-like protein n=1 Tax=Hyphopichia burtonii NRRL Y-1933 TaxID=984485 RepID=A0A1E4RFR4_9ASCO|nr:L domain-like protein [Hyphopichia burtonii NRRL Y-1933]ODV66100.1 L domain-like protein [Hyphopichia burtonii NRRL Y-1933]